MGKVPRKGMSTSDGIVPLDGKCTTEGNRTSASGGIVSLDGKGTSESRRHTGDPDLLKPDTNKEVLPANVPLDGIWLDRAAL